MFGINTSKDRLNQLIKNYEKLKRDASNVSLAEQVCNDTWHLTDWVLLELHDSGSPISKKQFRNKLYSDCPEFRTLHDIANMIKHKALTNPKVYIKKTNKHDGVFDHTFDSTFDISYLEIIYSDGTKVSLNRILNPAINYWINNIK